MSVSWRLNQYSRRLCVEKIRRQNLRITEFEPGIFGTRGRRSTFALLSPTTSTLTGIGRVFELLGQETNWRSFLWTSHEKVLCL